MTNLLNMTFLHSWHAPHSKKCKFYAPWHHFKSHAKFSYLNFCHEIVYLLTDQIMEYYLC